MRFWTIEGRPFFPSSVLAREIVAGDIVLWDNKAVEVLKVSATLQSSALRVCLSLASGNGAVMSTAPDRIFFRLRPVTTEEVQVGLVGVLRELQELA